MEKTWLMYKSVNKSKKSIDNSSLQYEIYTT